MSRRAFEDDSDYSGYDFWIGTLNQFNGNFLNAEMVEAFIVSGEYRQRLDPKKNGRVGGPKHHCLQSEASGLN
jgi:hypothetical protein